MATASSAATPATTPTADYEVEVRFVPETPGQGGPHCIPQLPASMTVGKTVHYSSNYGEVTMEFVVNRSPFQDAKGNDKEVITSKDLPLELMKPGEFTCHCFVTPTGSTARIGWDPVKSPQSGGNQVVKNR
jgi:hypothetical protein